MNILILEPNYSNFEQDLAGYLAKEKKDKIYSFIFNLGLYAYLWKTQPIFVNKKLKYQIYDEQDKEFVLNTKTLFSEQIKKREKRNFTEQEIIYQAKYVAFAKHFLKQHAIDFVVMHNDLRWQHALTIQVCQLPNIRYLVTEFGVFRPSTITVDFKGVNAYSSLPKTANFYQHYEMPNEILTDYSTSFFKQLWVYGKFGGFLSLNLIGQLFKLNVLLQNKQYSFLNYTKLFFSQTFTKTMGESTKTPKKYLFVPLQVNTDTQILVHSPFTDIQSFITFVENTYLKLPQTIQAEYRLVFKVHPMELSVQHYQFHPNSLVLNSDTHALIQDAALVITINSTVGFEALALHKKVLVLGEAFYKIPQICICSQPNTLAEDIINGLQTNNEPSSEIIDRFIAYLKYEYQINGNVYNYDICTLAAIKAKMFAD